MTTEREVRERGIGTKKTGAAATARATGCECTCECCCCGEGCC